jgi:uncharacterized protein
MSEISAWITGRPDDIRIVYRKFDGSLHWHMTMTRLGEDEHGVWAGTPAPSVMRKGDGPEVRLAHASVMLIPRGTWWTAAFNAEPARTEIYCDMTTPPQWLTSAEVTMVDLDLDVQRLRTGEVQLLDADEFAVHQVRYGYPADVIASAERSAEYLAAALADGTEPFASGYRHYLRLVRPPGTPA